MNKKIKKSLCFCIAALSIMTSVPTYASDDTNTSTTVQIVGENENGEAATATLQLVSNPRLRGIYQYKITGISSGSYLNFRTAASSSASIIGRLYGGEYVYSTSVIAPAGWLNVLAASECKDPNVRSRQGYISSSYASETGN